MLIDVLQWRAQTQPDQLAYTFLSNRGQQESACTYRDVYQRASAVGAALQSMDMSGEQVMLCCPPGLDFIAAFLGCLCSGAIAVPCYPPHRNKPNVRLKAILVDSQARAVLTTAHILENLHEYFPEPEIRNGLVWLAIDKIGAWTDGFTPASHDLAFLQYTSGSTSTPKGVMVSQANLMYNLKAIEQCFEHTPESYGVIWLPPYHDMGLVGGLLQPLYVGFPAVLLPPVDFVSFPYLWLQTISHYRATVSGGPNFAYDLCARTVTPEQKAALDLSSWKVAFNGAEPVCSETLDRFAEAFESCGFRRDAFLPCYGLAEATLIVSGGARVSRPIVRRYDRQSLQQGHAIPRESRAGCPGNESTLDETITLVGCGQSLAGGKIIIVDPESRLPCAPEQVGEIWISGPGIAQGYWGKSKETQETFHAYLAHTGEGPFLRTGDLGLMQDGELFVTGRLKDVIIIQGRNYYPQDIELTVEQSHLALQPGGGAAFSLDSSNEARLAIVYELKLSHRKVDVESVAQAIRLAVKVHYGLEVDIVALAKPAHVPKTSSGKIQRYLCRAMLLDGSLSLIGSSILSGVVRETVI